MSAPKNAPAPVRTLITVAVAAERLGLSRKTIYAYANAGRLTKYKVGPQQLRLDVAEVDALAVAVTR